MVIIGKTRASEMQSPKPMQYLLFINTIGGISLSFLQRLSYNVYLTTTFSHYFTKTFFSQRFSSKLLPQSLFHNVFLTMSFPQRLLFSQRLSNNAFPKTSFSQRFCHNVFITTSFSKRLSHNVFPTMSF